MWFQAWILMALAVSQCLASPFKRHFKRQKFLKLEVDCSDIKKVQQLELMRVPYKCHEGTDQYLEIVLEPVVPIQDKFVITDVETVEGAIVNSLDNCRNSKKCIEKLCEPNHVYAPSINKCVPRTSSWAIVPAQNIDERYRNRFEILTTGQCKTGYAYHVGMAKCLPQNHFYFQDMMIGPIRAQTSVPTYSFIKCGYDSVFVSEVGLCVPNLMMDRPQMDAPVPVAAPLISSPSRRCAFGFVYSPEVNLCLPFTKPPQRLQGPTSLSLIKDHSSKNPAIGRNKCKGNEFYMSEIDICIVKPERFPIMQNDAPAVVVTTEDPFRLTFSPLTDGKVGRAKCKKGQVYVSEIDLCMNNPGSNA